MEWYPLQLTTPTCSHAFGGTRIMDRLGRGDLPHERSGETWEVSDVEGDSAHIVEGPLAGRSLHCEAGHSRPARGRRI